MKALISRLSEPSTYAGFSGLAIVLGATAPQFGAFTTAAAALFGLVAVALGEKSAADA